jgi:hypothetical protein
MWSNRACSTHYFEVGDAPKFCAVSGSPTITECPECKKGLNTFKEQTQIPIYCAGCSHQLRKNSGASGVNQCNFRMLSMPAN